MDDLIFEGLKVDFYQGLDIRLVNQDNVGYLKRVKTSELRFAFDDMAYEGAVRRGIDLLVGNGINSRHLSFYVLAGFNGDETAIERMKILASLNVNVFPMVYLDAQGNEPERKILYDGDIFWHGSRPNIIKFLRLIGRLPG